MIPAQVDVEELLFSSLKQLGSDVTFDKVTVKQICETAGVSKRTFYNHFRDKYDLAAWGYARGLEASIRQAGPRFADQQLASLETVTRIGAYMNGPFETTHGADSFRRTMREVNRKVYGQQIRTVTGREPTQREAFMLDVFLGGLCEAYIAWWRDGMPIPAADLAAWAEDAMSAALAPILGIEHD